MSNQVKRIHFDDSVPVFVSILVSALGKDRVTRGWVLRDATGRLAFIASESLSNEEIAAAADAVTARMPAYCRSGRTILLPDQPGVSSIVQRARQSVESTVVEDESVEFRTLIPPSPLTVPLSYRISRFCRADS